MDNEELERLLVQCNSNDVDTKIAAITKLQALFESEIEITDKESVINAVKSCLRTSNQHLTTATLAAIPPLLPLLVNLNAAQSPSHVQPPSQSTSTLSTPSSTVDAYTLRQIINAFMPAGGVIERLGDNRDKARDKAREGLVVLGGLAFRSSSSGLVVSKSRDGKTTETPLMSFEKFLREGGLGSKVWKVREQSILTLIHLRRAHHFFPIRPYLPLLVAALEDSDAHVRECARDSVVELYTGPGVTDAARADLKAAMAKKNVRKGIVESILSKLVTGNSGLVSLDVQSELSENGDARGKNKEHIPPSLIIQGRNLSGSSAAGPSGLSGQNTVKEASRPPSRAAIVSPSDTSGASAADVNPVYITSSRDMEHEFANMAKAFDSKETEHNWAPRERAILRVRGMLKGDGHSRYMDTFLACLKEGFIQWSLKTLASLRTTVAVNTCCLYVELAAALGPGLDPFCDTLLTNLLKMATYTKKITAQQSQICVAAILTHCSAQPRVVIPLLWHTMQEKTVQARAFAVGHIKLYLELHGQRSRQPIEISGGWELLEKSVKRALADPNPAVRESARVCFWVFENVWPERGRIVLESLDNTGRKQLEKVCPDPAAAATIETAQSPKAKKTSVAAAIAASRAKAKAIAAAPPSLRHQATSHAARATSPPLKRAASPSAPLKISTPQRPASPLSLLTSSPPNSPRSRIASNPTRVATSHAVPTKSRSPPGSTKGVSPPSSPAEPTTRRSPLSSSRPTSGSSFRTAVRTALPASPPQSPRIRSTSPPRHNRVRAAVPVAPRPSVLLSELTGGEEDLLLASAIPIPEESDSEMDDPVNLLSFSAAFEAHQAPAAPRSDSQVRSFSPKSTSGGPSSVVNNAMSSTSTPSGPPKPVVEDALRARAEQAESAAERLLELVDDDEEAAHHCSLPTSLLVGSSALPPKSKTKLTPNPVRTRPVPAPTTPVNRSANILKQAAMFKNSPVSNGKSSSPSLLDSLKERKHETGWWLKRMSLIKRKTSSKVVKSSDRSQDLQSYISVLEGGQATSEKLQKLALLCAENPVPETTPSPLSADSAHSSPSLLTSSIGSLPFLALDMWAKGKNFTRLFNGLIAFLQPTLDEDLLEYGLIVLWEILHNQAPYIEGLEADIFTLLLKIRYCNKFNVLEATNTIRDALTTRIEPVYGLTTMHACLRDFRNESVPPEATPEMKASTYAFGLSALGKFILRLPAEVLEDELPRMRETLTSALNDKSSLVVRESAAASIIAAQLVLQDETHLFTLLDGLADEKKNLLTYLFEKHSVRAAGSSAATAKLGMDRLVKEMNRLDNRTSTPPRPVAAA